MHKNTDILSEKPFLQRRKSKEIRVGSLTIGGNAPIVIQSMTNTATQDVEASLAQINRLHAAGCELVRLAIPHEEAAFAFKTICEQSPVPLIADIHFDARLAVLAAEHGAAALRINPGNIGGEKKLKQVLDAVKMHKIPIRIGVNAGSLEKHLLEKHGGPTPEAMVESALSHIGLLEKHGVEDIKISLKSSSVPLSIAAYQLLSAQCPYPFHIGITEAGTLLRGTIKSSVGIGILLSLGLGDTLRVSLTGPPEEEVFVAWQILQSLQLRQRGPEIISCPTCGRTEIQLEQLALAVEERVKHIKEHFSIAIMGCVVNGPGEAREADLGIAGGRDKAVLFRKGEIIATVRGDTQTILNALMEQIDIFLQTRHSLNKD